MKLKRLPILIAFSVTAFVSCQDDKSDTTEPSAEKANVESDDLFPLLS